jgi:adenylyl-sulfate kinase
MEPVCGLTVWLTGLSGAGKTTLAGLLFQRLSEARIKAEVLDGDVVRKRLWPELGFSRKDRDENVRRLGVLCEMLSRSGSVVIVAAISPYRAAREELRSRLLNFVEVYVKCSLSVLVARDVKGLYKRALAGDIPSFTGVSDPYEPPLCPEVVVSSESENAQASTERILAALVSLGFIQGERPVSPVIDQGSSSESDHCSPLSDQEIGAKRSWFLDCARR